MKINKFWKKYEKDIIIHKNKMNIIESCLDRHAEKQPNKIAFIFENEKRIRKYSYKELNEEVNKFANLLNSLKIKQNSHIALFLPKTPELYISFLATIKSGNIAIPLFEAFQQEGLELRLKRGDVKVLITNKELSRRVKKRKNIRLIIIDSKEFKEKIKKQSTNFKTILKNRKDTALILFTSSTAGTPVAGIQIPHQALIQQHYTAKLVLDLKKEDRFWCTAHPGWVTGSIYGIIAPLSIGCTNYIYTPHFNDEKWLSFLTKHKISVLYTAPTALRLLKPKIKKHHFKHIKNLCSVGEALTKPTYDFYKSLGIEINDTYWQTETGAIVIANWLELKKKRGSMGKAVPGIKAKIEKGTIAIKQDFPSLMTGIYKHKKLYHSYFKNNWFLTKDTAEKDKDGYFFFIGREDDIIKTSGERVSPIEVESALLKHKAVKEAAVIGIPDKIKGSTIKAFIVLNKNIQPNEKLKEKLSMFVKKNYAGHSYPKQIQFIKKLPKTISGKIIRAKLRELK